MLPTGHKMQLRRQMCEFEGRRPGVYGRCVPRPESTVPVRLTEPRRQSRSQDYGSGLETTVKFQIRRA